jgi:hypothetical protein
LKDLGVLPLAEEDLFDQSVQSSFYPKSNLVLAIFSLEPQISIPLIARLMKSPEPEDRIDAARFLEAGSPDLSPILSRFELECDPSFGEVKNACG